MLVSDTLEIFIACPSRNMPEKNILRIVSFEYKFNVRIQPVTLGSILRKSQAQI